MKTHGIRIFNGKREVLSPKLYDILEKIKNGDTFYWYVLFLDGTPSPGQGAFITEYEKKINDSENGLSISWNDLKKLSDFFFQMFEITVIGSKNANLLHRYEVEHEMYTTCDIVIDLIDCAFWEIYSKEKELIERLKLKFKETELIDQNGTA